MCAFEREFLPVLWSNELILRRVKRIGSLSEFAGQINCLVMQTELGHLKQKGGISVLKINIKDVKKLFSVFSHL